MAGDRLRRAAQRAILKTIREGTPGKIGQTDGTIYYTDQNGVVHRDRVWVRLGAEGSQTEVVAYCTVVNPILHLPVRVADREHGPEVIGVDRSLASALGDGRIPETPRHWWTHLWGGPDPAFLDSRSFTAFGVRPTDPPSLAVDIVGGFYRWGGALKALPDTTSDSLAPYVPATSAVYHFVVICLDRANNELAVVDGTDKLIAEGEIERDDVAASAIPDAYFPLAAIRLAHGQTQIRLADIVVDARPFAGDVGGLDINGLPEETFVDLDADYVPFYDASASANRKVLAANLPGGGGGGRTLFYAQTVDAVVANTTSETSLLSAGRGNKTLSAELLKQGAVLRLTLAGYVSTTGTPDLTIKVTLGDIELCSTGAQAAVAASDANWRLEILITCRATGASGAVVTSGLFECDAGLSWGLAATSETTIDTTDELVVDVTATWGTADEANTITCQEAAIEHLATTGLAPVAPTGLTAAEV